MERVSNRQLAAGVFRAWGIVWAVYALMTLVQLGGALVHSPYATSQPGMTAYVVGSQAVAFACELLIFVFLMRRADRLAAVVFPIEAELGTGLSAADLRSVLFSAVGLYFLLNGAKNSVGLLYVLISRWRDTGVDVGRMALQPERLVSALVETALGAFVLLRRTGSGGPWKGARAAYDKTLGLHDPAEKERGPLGLPGF